jgi:POT family proton-dependent oligopeptide transporter
MAVETLCFIYIESDFIIGNGLFKPNMTSIISNAYHHPEKKTVLIQYYMGSKMQVLFRYYALCGYMDEKKNLGAGIGLVPLCYVECYSFIYTGHMEILVKTNSRTLNKNLKIKAAAENNLLMWS